MIDFPDLIRRQIQHDHESDSHTERDTVTYHPSSLSRCPRQCTISKLGLDEHSINTLWNFYLGTRQHDDLREWFDGIYPGVEFEKKLAYHVDHDVPDAPLRTTLHFTGRCDVYDAHDNAIYDFKTRKSWSGFDGASEAHKDQLMTYMRMAGVERGQLVYVVKSAPWDEYEPIVRTWPDDGWYEYDAERWNDIRSRAARIHDALREFENEHDRLPLSRDEVPFERCGCWLCSSENDTGESENE